MRKILYISIFICALAQIGYGCESSASIKVLVSQSATHPALDATTKGALDAIKAAGYTEGKNLTTRIESAQGNAAIAAQIASKFVTQKPDIIIATATLSAQSFVRYAKIGDVKVVFCTVTDPLAASLVDTLEKPGAAMSGVSNFVDLEPQMLLIKQFQPNASKIGILYNAGEINGVAIADKLDNVCQKLRLTLIRQTITKTADIPQATARLAQQVDAIYIGNDNTALSGFQSIVAAATTVGKPVYCSDTDQVEQGAVAAVGPNQYQVGYQAGEMAVRALNGAPLVDMAVQFPSQTELYINLEAAKKANITVGDDLKAKAVKLIESIKA